MFSYIVTKNYKIKTKNIKFEQKLEKNRKKPRKFFQAISGFGRVFVNFCCSYQKSETLLMQILTVKFSHIKLYI